MSGRRAKHLRQHALADPTPLTHPRPWTDTQGVRHGGDVKVRYRRAKKTYVRDSRQEDSTRGIA